ncbi:hypothetical protein OROMI_019749 [Orobanche minor]
MKVKTSALCALERLSNNGGNCSKIAIASSDNVILSLLPLLRCGDDPIYKLVFDMILNLLRFSPDKIHEDFPFSRFMPHIINLIRIELGDLGVIPQLMERLQSTNNDVKVASASLLCLLAKDTENQVAIVNNGGLTELIKLFNAQDDGVRKAVRKILFSFAQNEFIIPDFIKAEMERYFKRALPVVEVTPSLVNTPTLPQSQISTEEKSIEVDIGHFPSDPGLRPHIMSYPPNLVEQVRRFYILKGPCQPREHHFPYRTDGSRQRKFVKFWFDEFKTWLEYSISKDAAFCLYCYLFSSGRNENGHDAFVSGGFTSWRKKERLRDHVGDHNSDHNNCRRACEDLMNQAQHIEVSLCKITKQSKMDYRCRLNATIICLRYLVMQGLAFRGNDEANDSLNQGNFLEFLKILASCNEEINKVVLQNAPENHKLISPDIQRDIINAAAVETTKVIIADFGNELFSILVDECRDVSVKEQMGIVVRYVDKKGCVIERFLGLVHVTDTAATSLEKGIDKLFSSCNLSISSLRGQGYDGASNMKGEFKGLKSLILKRNPTAYYVHCFAHQLQLTIVAVAKKHTSIGSFFNTVTRLSNVVGGSCKRRDLFRESQKEKMEEGIANDEINTGRGLNQEMALKRPGDTRWSSHYGTLINLMHLFSSVVDVLEYVVENGNDDAQRAEADDLLDIMNHFEFVFVLHLMRQILGITHELSQVLQKKDQDIVNAMHLVKVAKSRLQVMRDDGWETLVSKVSKFCSTNEILLLDMEDGYTARGRVRRKVEKMTNLHHYRAELFYSVIDIQVLELNQRFDEVNTELLLCMTCFDPKDSFSAFDTPKLLCLAKFYPSEFPEVVLYELESQLENFIFDVRLDEKFSKVSGIGGLAKEMVSTGKHEVFPLVYLLIKLCLILPVATATVERAFSAMNIIKSPLRNRMGDQLLNDCLVSYIEKDVFVNVTNETIMQRYQDMKDRRGLL